MGQISYVRELADDSTADGVYEFLLCSPPLPITGAVGSPLNPMVLK